MTPESFAYWLQGFFELSDTDKLTEKQVQIVKDHLALVFEKVTPDRKKKKKITKLTDLPVSETSEAISVTPPTNPNQICLELEEFLKKKQREVEGTLIVTCDSKSQTPISCSHKVPTADELMETVKESARKSRERYTYPSPTRWIGGGFGQKYC